MTKQFHRMWAVVVTSFIVLLGNDVSAYSTGAPAGACDGMTPNHGVAAQTAPSSVNISLSSSTFNCNGQVTVTLGNTQLKGFLCQARPDPASGSTTGMIETGNYKNNCAGKAAITHTEGSLKSAISFNWKQSGTPQDFYIVCTFVAQKTTFWVKEQSAKITFSGTGSTCTSNEGTMNAPSLVSLGLVFSLWMLKVFRR